jgi:hypothetical protein
MMSLTSQVALSFFCWLILASPLRLATVWAVLKKILVCELYYCHNSSFSYNIGTEAVLCVEPHQRPLPLPPRSFQARVIFLVPSLPNPSKLISPSPLNQAAQTTQIDLSVPTKSAHTNHANWNQGPPRNHESRALLLRRSVATCWQRFTGILAACQGYLQPRHRGSAPSRHQSRHWWSATLRGCNGMEPQVLGHDPLLGS